MRRGFLSLGLGCLQTSMGAHFYFPFFPPYTNILFVANKPWSTAMANRRCLAMTSVGLDKAESTLRIKGNKITKFPRCSESNFCKLRADTRFAYFDKTSYISRLDSDLSRAILFLRPRRFGKSLTVSMLEYFHGIQHRDKYDELFKVGLTCSIAIEQLY